MIKYNFKVGKKITEPCLPSHGKNSTIVRSNFGYN